jgi:hypothetical protein
MGGCLVPWNGIEWLDIRQANRLAAEFFSCQLLAATIGLLTRPICSKPVSSMHAPRFSLRTLLILLAVLPPILALAWYFWPPRRIERAIEDNPYEIIWDDYAPDAIPQKGP